MTPEQERKVLEALYDRLYDAVTHAPDGKAGAFPKNIYFQMAKNQVLNPEDFKNMLSPVNPNGDQTKAEFFSTMVDACPAPGALWSDSGNKLSAIFETLGQANGASPPDPKKLKTYQAAFNFLNKRSTMTDFEGNKTEKVEPTPIAIAYDEAADAYAAAVAGYQTAYNAMDLTKTADQRSWNAQAPVLQNLVTKTWNAWARSGKAQVEQAQAAMQATINDAVSHAIEEAQKLAMGKLPTSTTTGQPWLPSYAGPTNWADPAAKGIQLSFDSSNLNKTSSSTRHTYGGEVSGSYWGFHASAGVDGSNTKEIGHMDAQKLKLSAELFAVRIVRPWFNPLLFGMQGWSTKAYKRNEISNGDAEKPQGKIPLYPTGFVVARNVTIEADFSEEDSKTISSTVDTKASGGWGPFTFSGKYGHSSSNTEFQSKVNNGKLVFPGLQLLAWISTVTPASPPLDPQ